MTRTRDNVPDPTRSWAAHPLAALAVRAFVLLAPLAGSFAFVHYLSVSLKPPTSSLFLYLSWWLGISGAATVVLVLVDRLARRLLPLSALLKLSLVFPDEIPSRLKLALRSGGVDTLEKRLALVREAKAAATPQEAAARLLELIAALNAHDKLTRGHSERVRAYSVLIGEELGLDKHDLELLNWAALLHDIGKLEVRQEILTKPGKPSEEEWQTLRLHPLFGERLTAPLAEWLERWQSAVGYHHERWDGKGYPRGLSGEEIPLPGRIVAVADVFDVITSARSYKRAGSGVDGRKEIAGCAGTQFDPGVVRAFLNVGLGRMRMIMGPLSWLSHAPLLGRLSFAPGFGAIAGTLGVVAAATAGGTLSRPAVAIAGRAAPAPAAVAPAPKRSAGRPARQVVSIFSRAILNGSAPAPPSPSPETFTDPATAPAAGPSATPTPAADASAPPGDGGAGATSEAPSTPPAPPPTTTTTASPAAPPPTTTTTTTASPAPPPPTTTTTTTASPPLPSPPPPSPPPVATQLVFTAQPASGASTPAGSPIPLAVSVEDAVGQVVTGDNSTTVTLSVASGPSGGSLTCTNPGGVGPVTVSSGVASFTCSLAKAGSYSLSASDSTGTAGHPYLPASGNSFDVTAAAASQLVFTAQPATAAAGSPIAPAVRVSVEDAFGNVVTGDNSTSVTAAIGTNPGAGTLSGTLTQTVSSGVASFADLSISSAGNGYTLTAASSPTYTAATSAAFDVTAGPGPPPPLGTQLAFTAQPASGASVSAGSSISLSVSVEDALGQVVTGDNSTAVTLSVASGPSGAALACTNPGGSGPVTVSSGVASFTCSLAKVGSYSLSASDTTGGGGHPYLAASSNTFGIVPGGAAQLVFTTQPSTVTAGTAISPPVRVSVEDASGNVVTSDNSTSVTVAIGTNPGGGTLSGTLTQTVAAGVASFNDLSISTAASGYSLTAASSPAHGTVTSSSFDVNAAAPPPPVATQLAFTSQPASGANVVAGAPISLSVSVEDAIGQVVTSDSSTTVTLSIASGPSGATLACTNPGGTGPVTVSSGVASFSCWVDKVGSYSLSAADTTGGAGHPYLAAAGNTFTATPAAAVQLAFKTQPANVVAGSSIAPAVQVAVEDAYGNVETGDNTTTVTIAIGTDPTGGTLAGTLTRTVLAGVASFGNLSITTAGSGYTLTATSTPANGSAGSNGFDVTPAAASQLAFTTQPTTTSTGSVISPGVQVSVEDAYGNVVSSDNATTVTVAIGTNPGGGTLSGTLTQTASAGVASFNDLSISGVGSGYTLTVSSSPAHGTATSNAFDVSAAATVGATVLATNSGHPCTSGASCTTASIAPAAGSTLLILVQRGGSTTTSDAVTSVTGPLTGATSVGALEYPLLLSRNYLFAWTATSNGSSGAVTVNFAGGSNANPTVVEVVQLSGNNTGSPIVQETTAASALLTATATLSSPTASDGEVILVSYLANASLTTPPGFTALDTISTGSNGGENYGVYFSSSAQASTSISSGGLGLGWGTLAIELTHG